MPIIKLCFFLPRENEDHKLGLETETAAEHGAGGGHPTARDPGTHDRRGRIWGDTHPLHTLGGGQWTISGLLLLSPLPSQNTPLLKCSSHSAQFTHIKCGVSAYSQSPVTTPHHCRTLHRLEKKPHPHFSSGPPPSLSQPLIHSLSL